MSLLRPSLASPLPLLVSAVFAALFTCGCAANVEVSVQVLTDLAPATDFDRVALERDGVEVVGRVVNASQRFDRPYVLAELTDVAPGSDVRLTVVLQRGGGRVLSRTIETRIDASRVLLFVLSSACRSVTCPPTSDPSATECDDGVCVRPTCQGAACSPDAGLQEEDAASVEADAPTPGIDAGLEPDAASALDAALEPDAPSVDAASVDAYAPPDAARDAYTTADAAVPPDAWSACGGRPAGYICRAASGPCDVEERCDGITSICPRNSYAASGTVCRDRARSRPCDAIETCSGTGPLCPVDLDERDGTRCDQYCGSETCMGGVCTGGVSCAPSYTCCGDVCSLPAAC
jgi:hypothetical protein